MKTKNWLIGALGALIGISGFAALSPSVGADDNCYRGNGNRYYGNRNAGRAYYSNRPIVVPNYGYYGGYNPYAYGVYPNFGYGSYYPNYRSNYGYYGNMNPGSVGVRGWPSGPSFGGGAFPVGPSYGGGGGFGI